MEAREVESEGSICVLHADMFTQLGMYRGLRRKEKNIEKGVS